MLRLASTLVLVSAFALQACGSDDDDGDKTIAKSLVGTLSYAGPEVGTLLVAISTEAVPVCPNDVPEKYVTVADAIFPYHFSFTGLKGGDYYVSALFDVNADLPFPPCPRSDDICGRSASFLTVNDAAPNGTLDFTLNVPGCNVTD